MRPLPIAVWGLSWLGLGGAATAQVPPEVLRPGTPGSPEMQGLTIPSSLPLPSPSPSPEGPPTTAANLTAPASGPSPIEIVLLGRQACVTPRTRGLARAEGGSIDVAVPQPNTLTVALSGSTAANSYLGCTGSAAEEFLLVQDFEIKVNDPKVRAVVLTLDSTLVGLLRGKLKAGAGVDCAELSVTPLGCHGCPPVGLAHPPSGVSGTDGRLCNEHLPPIRTPPLPPGRYALTARFLLRATGGGLLDSHAVADFSPDTSQPPDWVRVRDPFQGVSKKPFGFNTTITASPANVDVARDDRAPREPEVRRPGHQLSGR